jgi:hypothetical protein
MPTWLQSELDKSQQDYRNWLTKQARRPSAERLEMISLLRFLALVAIGYVCLYLVALLIPVGFDWKCCYLALFAIILPTPVLEQLYYSIGAVGAALPVAGLLTLLSLRICQEITWSIRTSCPNALIGHPAWR